MVVTGQRNLLSCGQPLRVQSKAPAPQPWGHPMVLVCRWLGRDSHMPPLALACKRTLVVAWRPPLHAARGGTPVFRVIHGPWFSVVVPRMLFLVLSDPKVSLDRRVLSFSQTGMHWIGRCRSGNARYLKAKYVSPVYTNRRTGDKV